jgi:hypothetical protein
MVTKAGLPRAFAAASLLVFAGGSANMSFAQATDVTAALSRCGAILDDARRHDCTDGVLRDAGMLPSAAARSTERRKTFGLARPGRPAVATVQKPPRTGKVAVAKAVPAKLPPVADDDSRIEIMLARVVQAGDGKLELTTAEGAVWRQVENEAVSPMPQAGRGMTIEKTALGGYRCITGKWAAFRCTRMN